MEKKKKESDGTELIRVVSGGIIVNREGKIFLARGVKFDGKYIVPGGGVHFGESVPDAAKREILEETGMKVEVIDSLGFSELLREKSEYYKKKHYLLCDFILQYSGKDDDIQLNEEYSGEYGWFSIEDALELELGGNVEQAILRYKEYTESKKALDNWKRSVAEFENYKKSKMNVERDLAGRAVEDFAYRLLPVVDNFHASTDHIPEDQKTSPWVQGIMYIQKQLEQVLGEMGVVEIETKEGDAFDPSVHEAVAGQGAGDSAQGTEGDGAQVAVHDAQKEGKDEEIEGDIERIKRILVRGYKKGDRVVRPVRVTIQ